MTYCSKVTDLLKITQEVKTRFQLKSVETPHTICYIVGHLGKLLGRVKGNFFFLCSKKSILDAMVPHE